MNTGCEFSLLRLGDLRFIRATEVCVFGVCLNIVTNECSRFSKPIRVACELVPDFFLAFVSSRQAHLESPRDL